MELNYAALFSSRSLPIANYYLATFVFVDTLDMSAVGPHLGLGKERTNQKYSLMMWLA